MRWTTVSFPWMAGGLEINKLRDSLDRIEWLAGRTSATALAYLFERD